MKQNTENNKEKFTGAEIFVKCLEAEGIDLVFGYPGGAVLHIYDELHKQNDVTHILVGMNRVQFMLQKVLQSLLINQE